MDSQRGSPASANELTAHLNAALPTVKDASQDEASDQDSHLPTSVSQPTSSLDSTSPRTRELVIEIHRSLEIYLARHEALLKYAPDVENAKYEGITNCFDLVRADASAETSNNLKAHVDHHSATSGSLKLISTDQVEVVATVSEPITRPAVLLPPLLALPERPTTISKMKDNVNFDMSAFFDFDAASEQSLGVPQSTGTSMPDEHSSDDEMLASNTKKDKFDPAVTFDEYFGLSKSEEGERAGKSTSSVKQRGRPALPLKKTKPIVSPLKPDEPKYRAKPDVDLLKRAFKAGIEDCFLPAFSGSQHDEDFAAFKAAGKSVNQQFQDAGLEFELRKAAAPSMPSPSRTPGQQAPEMSLALQKVDDEFTRAGQIYVAHVLMQNPQLSKTPEDTNHSYTEEDIQWARNYLSDDVKAWMKRSCGIVGVEKPRRTGLEKILKKAAPQPKIVLNHPAGPSSQKPVEIFSKATTNMLNFWTGNDRMMSLSELDAEWDTFEEIRRPSQTVDDDAQTSAAPQAPSSTLNSLFPASVASFQMVDDDEVSMIPTLSTPKPVTHIPDKSQADNFKKIITPDIGILAPGDSSLVPIVNKLSGILLDNSEEVVPKSHKPDGEESDADDSRPLSKRQKTKK